MFDKNSKFGCCESHWEALSLTLGGITAQLCLGTTVLTVSQTEKKKQYFLHAPLNLNYAYMRYDVFLGCKCEDTRDAISFHLGYDRAFKYIHTFFRNLLTKCEATVDHPSPSIQISAK